MTFPREKCASVSPSTELRLVDYAFLVAFLPAATVVYLVLLGLVGAAIGVHLAFKWIIR